MLKFKKGESELSIHNKLENYASSKEEMTVFRQFSEEKRADMIEKMITEQNEIYSLEEKLKEITKEYKDKIKVLKLNVRVCSKQVLKGGKEVDEIVYLIPNEQDNLMEYYSKDGKLQRTRKLSQREVVQLGLGGEKKDFKKLAAGDN